MTKNSERDEPITRGPNAMPGLAEPRKATPATLKDVRKALDASFDSVGFSKKDNCFVAKRGYFYRHGMNCENVANAIQAAIPGAVILETNDKWHAWPKDSFFEVRFRVVATKEAK